MSTPSNLGDLAYNVTAVFPLNTSTAIHYIKTSGTDTGTILTTSRTLDLSRAVHVGTTGGKPLDSTIHPRKAGAPKARCLTVFLAGELNFHSSGKNVFVSIAHKTRAAAAGAGSTWVTLKTDTKRFKMGTDTDAVFHTGLASSVNLQAVQKFYKANITYSFRKVSSTAAKDTSTDMAPFFINSGLVVLSGADVPQSVPASV